MHLPGWLADRGADEPTIGLFMGLSPAAAVVVRPFIGRLIDAIGRRPIVIIGALLNVASCALYLTVDGLGIDLVAVRLLQGVGQGASFSVFFTIAADLVPPSRRTEGIAWFGVSGMLPLSLGSLLGDFILARSGFDTLFVVCALIGATSLVFALPLRDRQRPLATVARRSFARVLLDPGLRPVWFTSLAFAIAITSYFTFLKTYLRATDGGSVGLFFSTYAVAAVILRIFFGWLPDRLGPSRTMVPALLASVAGLAVLSQGHGPVALLGSGLLLGIGHGYVFPILSGLAVTRAADSERGVAMSLFTALFDGGMLIGGPVLGAVVASYGHPTMFVGAAGFLLATIGVFWAMEQSRPRGDSAVPSG